MGRRTHILHIDSRDRVAYRETSSGKYIVPTPRILRNVVGARLLSAELPTSYYVFREAFGNTTLRVTVNNHTRDVTLPDGNYNITWMMAALQTALEEAFEDPGLTFTVTISVTTLKMSIQNLEGYTVTVHTDTHETLDEYSQTLAHFLGCPFGEVCEGDPMISPGIVSLNPFTYMMLDIRELNQGAYEGGVYGSRYSPSGVFSKVPVRNNSFEYTFWEPENPPTLHFRPPIPRLDRLTVWWRFHTMADVDFNGMDHSFTIEVITEEEGETDPMEDALQRLTHHVSNTVSKDRAENSLPATHEQHATGDHHTTHITLPPEKGIPPAVLYMGIFMSVCAVGYYMIYARPGARPNRVTSSK
jgi:hypothetical protein